MPLSPPSHDHILLPCSPPPKPPPSQSLSAHLTYLIFLIPGNPGLITYYTPFLTHLHSLLSSSSSSSSQDHHHNDNARASARSDVAQNDARFTVCGHSLAGFELHPLAGYEAARWKKGPWGLETQVRYVERRLRAAVRGCGAGEIRVVLVGHSMGAYILLEVLRRWGEEMRGGGEGGGDGEGDGEGDGARVRMRMGIVGGVCLFPTVVDIGRSASGRVMVTLAKIPYLDIIVSSLAYLMTILIPLSMLSGLIRLILRMPSDAAMLTARFVKSRRSVRQALFMAADEMRTITHDRWNDDVWGAAGGSASTARSSSVIPSYSDDSPSFPPSTNGSSANARSTENSRPSPKLFFLFGREDHWVANETRDALIASRGRVEDEQGDEWKPRMEIDETGLPHGFVIHHSIPVAEKAKSYIDEIVRLDRTKERR